MLDCERGEGGFRCAERIRSLAGVLPAAAAAGDLLLAAVEQQRLWIPPCLLAADVPMPQAPPPLPRRLFWQRMTTPNGTRYWWSHLLGRASVDVPAQGWGGWCAEEMGLGKVRCGGLWCGAGAARPQTPQLVLWGMRAEG